VNEIKYQVSKMAKMLGIYPSVLLIYLIITGKYFDVRRFNKHLERIFSDKSLKAIQIGSNDGISNDPLRKYIVQNDWDAVLIEAVPNIFKRLSNLYKDNDKVITLNVAISPSASSMKFYSVSPNAEVELGDRCPNGYDQLGSFQRENIIKHRKGILEPFITELEIPIKRIDQIVDEFNFDGFEVLHIDCEGYDLEVISTMSFSIHKPQYIIIEHKHMKEADKDKFIGDMTKIGYQYDMYFDDIIFTLSDGISSP
tara:strand:- start:247 stop:1008 length:762 start_codon:yes stop_codon:yes gene_type:complete